MQFLNFYHSLFKVRHQCLFLFSPNWLSRLPPLRVDVAAVLSATNVLMCWKTENCHHRKMQVYLIVIIVSKLATWVVVFAHVAVWLLWTDACSALVQMGHMPKIPNKLFKRDCCKLILLLSLSFEKFSFLKSLFITIRTFPVLVWCKSSWNIIWKCY